MESMQITIEGKELTISNPHKILWPESGITKLDYIHYLISVSPYLLAYTQNRLLTMIRFPDGIDGKSFYQKEIPPFAPEWMERAFYSDKNWILLNDIATLVWVANLASLEIHVPFDQYVKPDYPTELTLDLDPMDTDNFDLVREIALKSREVIDSLGLFSVIKTSGATGLQVYIPIEPRYTYEEARLINTFIARYIAEKNPRKVTLERMVKKRGKHLYFDYLQLWRGRTLPAPYSVRAKPGATVSTPLEWAEVEKEITPADFTIRTVPERLKLKGDLFRFVTTEKMNQGLDEILVFIKGAELTRV
ncbi:MAG: non-homologous end-joining DNA ligase [Bacillota bacterium]|uniref:DNA polymerase domain-containing protein n=1 Tax=Thermanaerosceptrum fracticalcis TaxID=1712410 RepID=A0A7G6E7C5_THEFR|nr:non-homologous end-joining DNA ligase [Thermanaerosceptrum fracticalcis]QNB47979.1 DNA polymerase domain-containing protein [Thermanaerosceptrum fracticalcis]